jgi:hypothetical protein
MLPPDWLDDRDTIVQREVLRAGLTKEDGLRAWTPEGDIEGVAHGEIRWEDSPFGTVLRTCGQGFVSFPAPKDILEMPGTVSFWVRKNEAQWDGLPWAWYGEYRGLLHIGSDTRETNALDIMMREDELWVRMYDHRGWETAALHGPSPAWTLREWHHVAVVWNRFNITAYIDGDQVAKLAATALPNGGQTTVWLGWRPTNPYGQASYCDLRVFRTPLPERRIRGLYDTRPVRH